MFDRTWFMQVLEGDDTKVRAAYGRIQLDPRHGDLVVSSQLWVSGRSFPDWSMGGTARTEDTEEIFIQHGLDRDFDPRRLSRMSLINLTSALQDHGRAKADAARQAVA